MQTLGLAVTPAVGVVSRWVTEHHRLQCLAVVGVGCREADGEGQSVPVRRDVHPGARPTPVHGARSGSSGLPLRPRVPWGPVGDRAVSRPERAGRRLLRTRATELSQARTATRHATRSITLPTRFFAGVDWSENLNEVVVIDDTGTVLGPLPVSGTSEGLRDILGLLRGVSDSSRHGRKHVPIAIETGQGLLVVDLRAAGQPHGGRAAQPGRTNSPAPDTTSRTAAQRRRTIRSPNRTTTAASGSGSRSPAPTAGSGRRCGPSAGRRERAVGVRGVVRSLSGRGGVRSTP